MKEQEKPRCISEGESLSPAVKKTLLWGDQHPGEVATLAFVLDHVTHNSQYNVSLSSLILNSDPSIRTKKEAYMHALPVINAQTDIGAITKKFPKVGPTHLIMGILTYGYAEMLCKAMDNNGYSVISPLVKKDDIVLELVAEVGQRPTDQLAQPFYNSFMWEAGLLQKEHNQDNLWEQFDEYSPPHIYSRGNGHGAEY